MSLENIFVSGIFLGLKPTIIMLLPPAITIGTVWTRHRWFNNRNRRSPLNFELLRVPGYGLSKKIEDLSFDISSSLAFTMISPLLLYTLYLIQIDEKKNSFMLKSQDGQTLAEDSKKRLCFQLEQKGHESSEANNKK